MEPLYPGFQQGIAQTSDWYNRRRDWLGPDQGGEFSRLLREDVRGIASTTRGRGGSRESSCPLCSMVSLFAPRFPIAPSPLARRWLPRGRSMSGRHRLGYGESIERPWVFCALRTGQMRRPYVLGPGDELLGGSKCSCKRDPAHPARTSPKATLDPRPRTLHGRGSDSPTRASRFLSQAAIVRGRSRRLSSRAPSW